MRDWSISWVAFLAIQQELGGTQGEALLLTLECGAPRIFLAHQGNHLAHARYPVSNNAALLPQEGVDEVFSGHGPPAMAWLSFLGELSLQLNIQGKELVAFKKTKTKNQNDFHF